MADPGSGGFIPLDYNFAIEEVADRRVRNIEVDGRQTRSLGWARGGTRLTRVIHRPVTRAAEIEGIIDLDQRDQCAACEVPIDRSSNYVAIIASWKHRERGSSAQNLLGGCITVDDAEELAIFCSEECLHEGLKRGLA